MEDSHSHWERWHQAYEDPDSPLSVRLRLVQDGVRGALERAAPGRIRLVSMCAGQGRDVIDVLAEGHGRAGDVRAVLVEKDAGLASFARDRASAAGLTGEQVRVIQDDASLARVYVDAGAVPADLVLVCGVFGNISDADVAGSVAALPSFCRGPGTEVIWTRHRRSPDLTPAIRAWFAGAGFEEIAFHALAGPYVLSVGHHRYVGPGPAGLPPPLEPGARLFEFVGDGGLPA